MQAVIITFALFVGLSLFTIQSKWDFSGMGPFLFGSLWILIIVGFIQLFLPFNQMFDLAVAAITAIVFCGYIIYVRFVLFV
jgi:protein lifeguard